MDVPAFARHTQLIKAAVDAELEKLSSARTDKRCGFNIFRRTHRHLKAAHLSTVGVYNPLPKVANSHRRPSSF
jgi:hypothetical protein